MKSCSRVSGEPAEHVPGARTNQSPASMHSAPGGLSSDRQLSDLEASRFYISDHSLRSAKNTTTVSFFLSRLCSAGRAHPARLKGLQPSHLPQNFLFRAALELRNFPEKGETAFNLVYITEKISDV